MESFCPMAYVFCFVLVPGYVHQGSFLDDYAFDPKQIHEGELA